MHTHAYVYCLGCDHLEAQRPVVMMSQRITNPANLTYWALSTVYCNKWTLVIFQPVELAKLDHGSYTNGLSLISTMPGVLGRENHLFESVSVGYQCFRADRVIKKVTDSVADDKAEANLSRRIGAWFDVFLRFADRRFFHQ